MVHYLEKWYKLFLSTFPISLIFYELRCCLVSGGRCSLIYNNFFVLLILKSGQLTSFPEAVLPFEIKYEGVLSLYSVNRSAVVIYCY